MGKRQAGEEEKREGGVIIASRKRGRDILRKGGKANHSRHCAGEIPKGTMDLGNIFLITKLVTREKV